MVSRLRNLDKYLAEFLGTFVMMIVGTGYCLFVGSDNPYFVALAFVIPILVMIFAVGDLSGAHFNPAVSLAFWLNKELTGREFGGYILAQFLGATLASGLLRNWTLAVGLSRNHLGETDFTINAGSAFLIEMTITFILVVVIVFVTDSDFGRPNAAPWVIGAVLGCLIVLGQKLTGASLNPARSFGPAIFLGGRVLQHYWLYALAPLMGSALAALVYWLIKQSRA
ncbi:MIP/aquaporin family protein [Lapidilactobacillus luobeiensis]|uniref:MIP/aquaporin family protein n=1 Tax=Lapidilactobacillus luobeiensis TaxID=2950371 RepID=UPI0021C46B77|nr:aquaporin [Lapidilactobacillus luobeiensis]